MVQDRDVKAKKSNLFAIVAALILCFQPWLLFLGGEYRSAYSRVKQEIALDVRNRR
jgi:hypothetical protein